MDLGIPAADIDPFEAAQEERERLSQELRVWSERSNQGEFDKVADEMRALGYNVEALPERCYQEVLWYYGSLYEKERQLVLADGAEGAIVSRPELWLIPDYEERGARVFAALIFERAFQNVNRRIEGEEREEVRDAMLYELRHDNESGEIRLVPSRGYEDSTIVGQALPKHFA